MEVDMIENLFEQLTGQKSPFFKSELSDLASKQFSRSGIDHSQFNELLLMLGYDRVTIEFFRFLADNGPPNVDALDSDYPVISSIDAFRSGIKKFQRLALLLFGNTKYAFKTLSSDSGELRYWVAVYTERDPMTYSSRNPPMMEIEAIPADETYYLGYIVQREIKEMLEKNPDDNEAIAQQERMSELISIGKRNNAAYLFSDHLDVYVATSMRLRHEYTFINRLTAGLFQHEELKELKLRWFDPTQAYCDNRIDKGLSEALMLRRAKCTLYLAQESDTLGKDSELASTLAQGKPVVAYIPNGDDEYYHELFADLERQNPLKERAELVREQLRIFSPASAWEDPLVRKWLSDSEAVKLSEIEDKLKAAMKDHYDSRANTLKETHPLGIQVNLATGVANGVLVVRTIKDCGMLIRKILTQSMEFDIDTVNKPAGDYILLRERISGSVFRVMTGDAVLTNAFWNFYLATQ